MLDCLASSQSGTGLEKTNDAVTYIRYWYRIKVMQSSIFTAVLDWDDGCWNADAGITFLDANAGITFLDADAHLCKYPISLS
jgi:hypothetical protein